jgi:carbonic anhydrase
MSVLNEVLAANKSYVENFGEKGKLALPPARQFAILTCMDARLDPAKYAGLSEGDAHVIRNAGARASDDAIRSLVISYKLLGTKEWFVILETAALGPNGFHDVGKGPGSNEGAYIDWLTISNRNKAVVEDVERIRRHPLVPKNIPIYGYVYEVETGKLIEIPEATSAGAAK